MAISSIFFFTHKEAILIICQQTRPHILNSILIDSTNRREKGKDIFSPKWEDINSKKNTRNILKIYCRLRGTAQK